MCRRCWELVSEHYPHLSESERVDLLWGATAFPAGGPEYVEKQLIELKASTDGSLEQALGLAEREMDRCFAMMKWPPNMWW